MSVTGDVERRPGRPRDARADRVIVEATLAEVAEKGFSGATVDGIATRAGVGKATIYRRWRGKEALLAFVAGQVSDVCPGVDTGTLRGDLLAIFQPMVEHLGRPAVRALLPELIAEAARTDETRTLIRNLAEERRRPALQAMRRGIRRGELEAGAPVETIADMIVGALMYRHLVLGEQITHREIVRVVDEALRDR
jgi:AcrR family transcriptional regulator